MKHLHSTTNKVERLLSRATIVMTGLLKSLTPQHLVLIMFLRMSRCLWNEMTVEVAIFAASVF